MTLKSCKGYQVNVKSILSNDLYYISKQYNSLHILLSYANLTL